MPLPRSNAGCPPKAVTLEFSPDLFRGSLREKDLEAISLDVIDQAHAIRKPFFRGFVLGVLDCGQAFLKSADVGRVVREGVIGEANPAGKICGEEFSDCFCGKTKIREAFAIRFADKMILRASSPPGAL